MATQKQTQRISKKIKDDVQKMGKFLDFIGKNKKEFQSFFENPISVLRKNGIDLEEYGTTNYPAKEIANEIVAVTKHMVDRTFTPAFQLVLDSVMKTSPSYYKETGVEYNFDHSTHTDYRYEIHTDTERGAAASKETGSAISTDQGFGFMGVTLEQLEELKNMLSGPLISAEGINMILLHMEKSLISAEMR